MFLYHHPSIVVREHPLQHPRILAFSTVTRFQVSDAWHTRPVELRPLADFPHILRYLLSIHPGGRISAGQWMGRPSKKLHLKLNVQMRSLVLFQVRFTDRCWETGLAGFDPTPLDPQKIQPLTGNQ